MNEKLNSMQGISEPARDNNMVSTGAPSASTTPADKSFQPFLSVDATDGLGVETPLSSQKSVSAKAKGNPNQKFC